MYSEAIGIHDVTGDHSDMPVTVEDSALASERLIDLINQLRDEYGGEWGWKRKVSARTGINNALITRVEKGDKTRFRLDSIYRAAEKMGLDISFFFDASAGDNPDYKQFISTEDDGRDTSRYSVMVPAGKTAVQLAREIVAAGENASQQDILDLADAVLAHPVIQAAKLVHEFPDEKGSGIMLARHILAFEKDFF